MQKQTYYPDPTNIVWDDLPAWYLDTFEDGKRSELTDAIYATQKLLWHHLAYFHTDEDLKKFLSHGYITPMIFEYILLLRQLYPNKVDARS